jgi:hypothetical protein
MSRISLLLVGALLIGGSAYAETSDTTLAPPGCYVGTGCDQNGWAVSSNSTDTELGLTAIIRGQGAPGDNNLGPTNPGSIDGTTYYIPYGPEASSPTHALWNFSWSINTAIAGNTQTLSDFTYLLTITDTTTGLSTSFDPTAAALGDNTTGPQGVQNSESPSFGFISVPLAFNDNAPDDYVITLTESQAGVGVVNSDSINVDVVTPEPSTITLAGLSLCALWFVRRRQMQRS